MKNFLSIPEVAKICSVNRSTVNRWVSSGKIKSYSTPGRHHRIQIEDLELFFKQNNMPIDIKKYGAKKNKILIIDDDVAVQLLLKKILHGLSMETETCSDGFEAGIRLATFKPDLVILDLFMPRVDGFDVCRIIKKKPETSDIKILVITGQATKENRNRAISLGADAVLEKPVSNQEIKKQVQKLLT